MYPFYKGESPSTVSNTESLFILFIHMLTSLYSFYTRGLRATVYCTQRMERRRPDRRQRFSLLCVGQRQGGYNKVRHGKARQGTALYAHKAWQDKVVGKNHLSPGPRLSTSLALALALAPSRAFALAIAIARARGRGKTRG